jgi:hypothetical protein
MGPRPRRRFHPQTPHARLIERAPECPPGSMHLERFACRLEPVVQPRGRPVDQSLHAHARARRSCCRPMSAISFYVLAVRGDDGVRVCGVLSLRHFRAGEMVFFIPWRVVAEDSGAASLNRPGANVTGVTSIMVELVAKQGRRAEVPLPRGRGQGPDRRRRATRRTSPPSARCRAPRRGLPETDDDARRRRSSFIMLIISQMRRLSVTDFILARAKRSLLQGATAIATKPL